MAQIFQQIIYCNDTSNKNSPQNLTKAELISGSAFPRSPIIQLGIQAPPGTKFYVNNNQNPVIIGFTGLFELDLTSGGNITSLTFDPGSLELIQSNDSNILIVDMVYLGGS